MATSTPEQQRPEIQARLTEPSTAGAVGNLKLVEAFIDGAEGVYSDIAGSWLEPLGFTLIVDRQDDRIVLGPESSLYTVRHRYLEWRSDTSGRFLWFWLESEIPHMSSIVACLAVPTRLSQCPLFAMNLNLKVKAGTFNTIIGYRGNRGQLRNLSWRSLGGDVVPGMTLRPVLMKRNPPEFDGVRTMFWLDSLPILWSLDTARRSLDHWFAAIGSRMISKGPAGLVPMKRYAAEMVALHGSEGGVYDSVFGTNWLSTLFSDHVFDQRGEE